MMAATDESGAVYYVSGHALRAVLGVFPTGVTVVATMDKQGRRIGVTANSFTSVSLDPPLILWCLRNGSSAFEGFCENPRFAISIMADDQADISKHFAMPIREKFTGHEFEDGLGGVPLISGAAGWLECIKESQHPGGDHTIFIGKVVRCSISGKFPLLFCGGSYLRSSGKWSPKAARLSNRRVREDDS